MALGFDGNTLEGCVGATNPLIDLGAFRCALGAATATGCIHGVFLNLTFAYPLLQHTAHGLRAGVKMDAYLCQGGIATL